MTDLSHFHSFKLSMYLITYYNFHVIIASYCMHNNAFARRIYLLTYSYINTLQSISGSKLKTGLYQLA